MHKSKPRNEVRLMDIPQEIPEFLPLYGRMLRNEPHMYKSNWLALNRLLSLEDENLAQIWVHSVDGVFKAFVSGHQDSDYGSGKVFHFQMMYSEIRPNRYLLEATRKMIACAKRFGCTEFTAGTAVSGMAQMLEKTEGLKYTYAEYKGDLDKLLEVIK